MRVSESEEARGGLIPQSAMIRTSGCDTRMTDIWNSGVRNIQYAMLEYTLWHVEQSRTPVPGHCLLQSCRWLATAYLDEELH